MSGIYPPRDNTTGFVTGPSGSTNNDIVTFNGTSGTIIKDSGIPISSIVTGGGTGIANRLTYWSSTTTIAATTWTFNSGNIASFTAGQTISVIGTGTNSQQFGLSTAATGLNSLAVGSVITAGGANSTVIGNASSDSGFSGCVIIGRSCSVTGVNAFAIGTGASAGPTGQALGVASTAATESAAIGFLTVAGDFSTSIGSRATDNSLGNCVSIGYLSSISGGANSIVIGSGASSTSANSIAIGSPSSCTGANICIGNLTNVSGDSNVVISPFCNTLSTSNNVIIGYGSYPLATSDGYSTVVGYLSVANDYSVAIGSSVGVASRFSIGIGYGISMDSVLDGAIAIGTATVINGGAYYGIAIGNGASVGGDQGIAIGPASYCNSTNSLAIGKGAGVSANVNDYCVVVGANSVTNDNSQYSIVIGTASNTDSDSTIVIGYGTTINSSSLAANSIVMGVNSTTDSPNVVLIGPNASSVGSSSSVVIGNSAQVTSTEALVCIGSSAQMSSGNNNSIIVGANTSLGAGTTNNILIGVGSNSGDGGARGTYSISIGNQSNVDTKDYSILIGHGITPTTPNQCWIANTSAITDFIFGQSVPAAAASIKIKPTWSAGTNISGGSLTLVTGLATGNAASGDFIVSIGAAGTSGATLQTEAVVGRATANKRWFFGGSTTPTAIVHIAAGTTSASNAPLKFTSGSLQTTAEAGAVEFLTDKGYLTITTGAARKELTLNDAALTSGTIPVATTNGRLTDSTLTVAAVGRKQVSLFDDFADANNTTTTETDLITHTLAAGQLATNGDKIFFEAGGIYTGAATATQQLRMYFGGTLIFDSGALSIGAVTSNWEVCTMVIRESSTVIRAITTYSSSNAALSVTTTYTRVTGLTLSGTNIFKITGTAAGIGAASNQITSKLGNMSYLAA